MSLTTDKISRLQRKAEYIRNFCFMAHVDHGKTTLADSLIATNGIISQRMCGKIRYLDNRKDEQERGITMKSSAIALTYNKGDADYLINMIDSPGHVDFTGEVCSAIQICDGALIVVDVVDGVCAQTKVSIREAWSNGIQMVLILNKMDRLITEMKFSPTEAYYRLQQILEQVNAVVGELFTLDIYQRTEQLNTKLDQIEKRPDGEMLYYDWSTGLEESDDSNLYFSPELGNVVFTSGLDCWGFRITHFAKMYASKLNLNETILLNTLWGDYYYDAKLKRVIKGAQAIAKKPLFVQLILENIWSVYDAVIVRHDRQMIDKIINVLDLKLHARDTRGAISRSLLQAIFSQWLPLAASIFDVVCDKLPSPASLPEDRAEKLMCTKAQRFHSLPDETQKLKSDFLNCSSADNAPVIVFVSKMFAVDKATQLSQRKPIQVSADAIAERRELVKQRLSDKGVKSSIEQQQQQQHSDVGNNSCSENSNSKMEFAEHQSPDHDDDDDDFIFVAFSRIFSGTIRKGQKLYVMGPKHDPAIALERMARGYAVDPNLKISDLNFDEHVTLATIDELYLLMGRDLEPTDRVPAGCIFGIGQLDSHVIKCATLSSTLACPPFVDLTFHSRPILRVAVEPFHSTDLPRLVRGLKLLNQADANVKVLTQESGEMVIITSGEVHLQRCLDDLTERFAKVKINCSSPIVPFRETIVSPPKVDMVKEAIDACDTNAKYSEAKRQSDFIEVKTSANPTNIRIKAVPLPEKVVELLDEYVDLIKIHHKFAGSAKKESSDTQPSDRCLLDEKAVKAMEDFKKRLQTAFIEAEEEWDDATVDHIWAFGPKHCGPNILLNRMLHYKCPSYWSEETEIAVRPLQHSCSSEFSSSFVAGFQLATNSGPLCREPLRGVCFIVEECMPINTKVDSTTPTRTDIFDDESAVDATHLHAGPFSGQLISAVQEACLDAFKVQPQRLVAALYSCNILVTADVLGKMYAVLAKRNGRVLHADLHKGSAMFQVTAVLPVVESFDFASEIRRQTSGLAMPQLIFSHWETIDLDPFWVPTTKEEYLLFGEKSDCENRAFKYMNLVRRRKGLAVEEKIIQHAEKQRTLARKK